MSDEAHNGQAPEVPKPPQLIVTFADENSVAAQIQIIGRLQPFQLAGIARFAERLADALMTPAIGEILKGTYGSKLVLPR